MAVMKNPFDTTALSAMALMENLAVHAMHVHDSIHELQRYPDFYNNVDFQEFIVHFEEGMDHHLKGMGYLDAMIGSKTYSSVTISYWLNKYIYPEIDHFEEAFTHLDKVSLNPSFAPNPAFDKLMQEVGQFKQVLSGFSQLIYTL